MLIIQKHPLLAEKNISIYRKLQNPMQTLTDCKDINDLSIIA